jgi:hypothetical protein
VTVGEAAHLATLLAGSTPPGPHSAPAVLAQTLLDEARCPDPVRVVVAPSTLRVVLAARIGNFELLIEDRIPQSRVMLAPGRLLRLLSGVLVDELYDAATGERIPDVDPEAAFIQALRACFAARSDGDARGN